MSLRYTKGTQYRNKLVCKGQEVDLRAELFIYLFDLFIYLFTYRFWQKVTYTHARVFFYYCCYFTKRKLCEYCTIHFNMRVQNPVITTVMAETLMSTYAAERSFRGMKRLKREAVLFGNTPHTQAQECEY